MPQGILTSLSLLERALATVESEVDRTFEHFSGTDAPKKEVAIASGIMGRLEALVENAQNVASRLADINNQGIEGQQDHKSPQTQG